MEVVTIEKRTFSYVCERFTEFAKRIESLCNTHTPKVENWLDSQEVCLLLGFSKRTLQYYRSSGRLAYSQIGSKIYYKSSDIERIIADSETQNQSPQKTCLMKRTKEDYPSFNLFPLSAHGKVSIWILRLSSTGMIKNIFFLLYMYRKLPNRLHPLLMRYSKMVASILLPLRLNGSM